MSFSGVMASPVVICRTSSIGVRAMKLCFMLALCSCAYDVRLRFGIETITLMCLIIVETI